MAGRGFGAKIAALFRGAKDESLFEDLEDLLIEGDVGAAVAMEISEALKKSVKASQLSDKDVLHRALKEILGESLLSETMMPLADEFNLFLILGVNGVGKTTTAAKLAAYYREKTGMSAVLAAGDTFRAAAIDQLKLHGERLGMRVVHQQPGSDPGAVLFDTIESARAKSERLIIADTAGRMHNRSDLVRELQKIDKVIRNRIDNGYYRKLLVIDATTGQNGIRQAEIFHQAVGVDGVILAKYDSDAKGGIAFSISRSLQIPIVYIGTGESYGDIHPFEKESFLSSLLGDT